MSDAHDKPMPSSVAIMQHPLHPMAVVFPIAFLIGTFVTDLVFWWHGDPFWALMSFWLAVAGLVTGLAAATLGLLDFLLMTEVRQHVAAWSHMIVAMMALSLAGANVRLRLDAPVDAVLPWGLVVSCALVVVVSIAGWLGGTLTFRHGIGTYAHADDSGAAGDKAAGGGDADETAGLKE